MANSIPLRPRFQWPLLVSLVFAACGGAAVSPDEQALRDATDVGSTIEPTTETDRALLASMSSLGTGAPRRVGQVTATAEAPYFAASGKECRRVHTSSGDTTRPSGQGTANASRLACRKPGEPWHFVPDVLAAAHSAASAAPPR